MVEGLPAPETWHHGLVATWWAEFNDDFRPHEIAYFRRHIERDGQPALDVACGAGRLLLPYVRAGLEVDGCDISADMVEHCRAKAAREGLTPTLFVQPMYQLTPPRRYRTIVVCGAFGLGSTREHDAEALRRFGRLDSSRSAEGAGLGLALAEAIAHLHDGELVLEDNAPGLLTAIELPLRHGEASPSLQ